VDEERYTFKQAEALREHEARCKRCGDCCGGYDSDPCANLAKDSRGAYYCRDYDHRLGPQKTVSGRAFTCVEIRDIVKFDLPYASCAYKK